MKKKLYWFGNSAKTKTIGEILDALPPGRETVVFDYGCGDGGDWPNILKDYPGIRVWGFEPFPPSFQKAKQRLQGLNAQLFTGSDLDKVATAADFIVSFSVFEHVYDRRAYLAKAKSVLGKDGMFYLNYDDGHFRNTLDLNRPEGWKAAFREWKLNKSAGLRAVLKRLSGYQRRVTAQEIEGLTRTLNFKVVGSRYDNLLAFKSLAKTIPEELRTQFGEFWLEVEERLNTEFCRSGKLIMGDDANLWGEMVSKTILLRHSD